MRNANTKSWYLSRGIGIASLTISLLLAGANDLCASKKLLVNSSSQKEDMVNAEQQVRINGTVTDAEGIPIPGVNVYEKGTTNGAVTDLDGNYSINISSPNALLSFSFIGYLTEEIEAGGQTIIDIVLIEDILSLDEVVVVGYGTMKKSDLTGSVLRADIESFRDAPNTSIMQSLQGSVAGVQIGQVNRAGQDPSISIRGETTINGSKTPLIILDGTIYRGRITDINSADIESIDVLKDRVAKPYMGHRLQTV